MSKFNKNGHDPQETTNIDGYKAYSMSEQDELVSAVLTSMFGEQKFYGDNSSRLVELAVSQAKTNPEFVAKLAVYARQTMNLRSVSHVLASVIARYAHEYTKRVIGGIVVRPDDMTEIMSCYKSMYGKPFPNAMKRAIAECMNRFNEYSFGKYNGGTKELKLRDILRITHPVPKDKDTEVLFGKIMSDTLATPYTWETELSAKGNTKEVWDELIASGKVGYMALLRNLRNIIQSGTDVTPVLEKLSDPNEVRNSRQLPFRFFSAYKTLLCNGLIHNDVTDPVYIALEKAISASVENMDRIPGRTLIAVDKSGSMTNHVSKNSIVSCSEIGKLLGVMASRICDDATVCYFDWTGYNHKAKGYEIIKYGKYDPILDSVRKAKHCGGGTDMSLPMLYALNEDKSLHPFDRVIYLSDNECNSNISGLPKTTESYIDEYRRKFNKNFWVHAIDLRGYGTQQFRGNHFNMIAGWSEAVLPFINTAEQGFGGIVDAINATKI